MAVKIWDDALRAFKDAGTPLVYDENLRAWKESTGLVWNDGAQAWEERWSPKLWLYDRGKYDGSKIEFAGLVASVSYNWGYYHNFSCLITKSKINLHPYKRIRIDAQQPLDQAWVMIALTQYNDGRFDQGWKCSDFENGNGILEMDVEGIDGEWHVAAGVCNGDSKSRLTVGTPELHDDHVLCYNDYYGRRPSVKTCRLWLEK